MMHGQKYIK